jgi:LmbE family N-acetylglucosaminyl deacetylase
VTAAAAGARHDRVLVVAAHPDDPEFLFGATIARLAEHGAVAYVICTDGCQGSEDTAIPDAELSAARCAEQRAAATVLGVGQVTFLGFRDGSLAPTIELRAAIAREIRRFEPDLVLTHAPVRMLTAEIGFSHPDHLAVGEATMSAVEVMPALGVREVWLPGQEQADLFVDATGVIDRKVEAVLRHRSQCEDPDTEAAWVRDSARRVGEMAGCEYAERFRRVVLA